MIKRKKTSYKNNLPIEMDIHKKLTPARKKELEKVMKRVLGEYGECLRKLGKT